MNSIISELIQFGKLLHEKNFVASFDGNMSYRLSDEKVLITSSGTMKGFLQPSDFVVVNLSGKVVGENKKSPSSETLMHLEIYKNQKKAKSIFHAHPSASIAFSVSHPHCKEFPLDFISELVLALGQVPIIPYQKPGSLKMGLALTSFIQKSKVLVLAKHGVVSWGETISEAYRGVERIEHAANIYMKAKQMGKVSKIDSEDYSALIQMREKIGLKTL